MVFHRMGGYRTAFHHTAGHQRVRYRSSPFLREVYPKDECHSSPFLQEVCRTAGYQKGPPLAVRMIRQMPVPAHKMQVSMQQIVWKYFRNLMCSRQQRCLR